MAKQAKENKVIEEDMGKMKQEELVLQEAVKEDVKSQQSENKKEPENIIDNSWSFDGVVPTIRNGKIVKYNLSLSAAQIGEMYLNGQIIYKGDIQRGYRITKNNQIIEIFKPKKITEILQEMISGDLHGGTIILNYSKENPMPLEFDETNNTLSGDSPLFIIDGHHRTKGCSKFVKLYKKGKVVENPEDFEFPVTIENLTDEEASDCFNEYATKPLKISRTRAEYLNTRNYTNYMVRRIMKYSEIKGKVDCVGTTHRRNNITTFSILVQAIDQHFKPPTEEQATEVSNYLCEFLNKLVNMFPEIMGGNINPENRMELRKNNLHIEALTWFGYIALFKNLVGKEDVDQKLAKLKNKIKIGKWEGTILDRSCPIWSNTIMRSGDRLVNTRSTQKIIAEIMVNYIMEDKLPLNFSKAS